MHYVNNDWQLGMIFVIYCLCTFLIVYTEELLIDFHELIGSHSGKNMALTVWDTLELYSLKSKVGSPFIIILGIRLTITILLGTCYQLQ